MAQRPALFWSASRRGFRLVEYPPARIKKIASDANNNSVKKPDKISLLIQA
jgi:hypothetical protein